jgi:hypothetical protein
MSNTWNNPEETSYELIDEGWHDAVCYLVAAVGTQPGGVFEDSSKIVLGWTLTEESGSGRKLSISRIFTLTGSPKGKYRPFVSDWVGRQSTEEWRKSSPLDLLCRACRLKVEHAEQPDGRIREKVHSIDAPAKGTPARLSIDNAVAFNVNARPFQADEFARLPEWVRTMIVRSPEYAAATAAQDAPLLATAESAAPAARHTGRGAERYAAAEARQAAATTPADEAAPMSLARRLAAKLNEEPAPRKPRQRPMIDTRSRMLASRPPISKTPRFNQPRGGGSGTERPSTRRGSRAE